MSTLKPLEIVIAKLRQETLTEPIAIIDVPNYIVDWARFHAQILVERYRVKPRKQRPTGIMAEKVIEGPLRSLTCLLEVIKWLE